MSIECPEVKFEKKITINPSPKNSQGTISSFPKIVYLFQLRKSSQSQEGTKMIALLNKLYFKVTLIRSIVSLRFYSKQGKKDILRRNKGQYAKKASQSEILKVRKQFKLQYGVKIYILTPCGSKNQFFLKTSNLVTTATPYLSTLLLNRKSFSNKSIDTINMKENTKDHSTMLFQAGTKKFNKRINLFER